MWVTTSGGITKVRFENIIWNAKEKILSNATPLTNCAAVSSAPHKKKEKKKSYGKGTGTWKRGFI